MAEKEEEAGDGTEGPVILVASADTWASPCIHLQLAGPS